MRVCVFISDSSYESEDEDDLQEILQQLIKENEELEVVYFLIIIILPVPLKHYIGYLVASWFLKKKKMFVLC